MKRETLPNVVLMLGQRLRRWPNIKTTLGQRLVFFGRVYFLYVGRLCSLDSDKQLRDNSVFLRIFRVNIGPMLGERLAVDGLPRRVIRMQHFPCKYNFSLPDVCAMSSNTHRNAAYSSSL